MWFRKGCILIMAVAGKRPISPHLQVYKWGPHMAVSIFHRISGDGAAIVGGLLFLAWLGSAAAGKEAYDAFLGHAGSWYGLVVLIGLTWAFANHACSGIRHLLLDTGAGYELKSNRTWSIASLVGGVLITAIVWLFIFYGRL